MKQIPPIAPSSPLKQWPDAMSSVFRTIESPTGKLTLVANGDKLAAVLQAHDDCSRARMGEMAEDAGSPVLLEIARQLNEFFAGRHRQFELEMGLRCNPVPARHVDEAAGHSLR
jgi:hypothetical protein